MKENGGKVKGKRRKEKRRKVEEEKGGDLKEKG